MAKNSMGKRELDLKDYLYYAFKEFSRYPNNQIWATYLTHWDEVYAQLVEIVEQHFHNLEPHPIEREGPISQYKTKPDPDTQEGVELIPWLNQLRSDIKLGLMNPQWRYTPQDRDYDNLGMLKQLLRQKPQIDVEKLAEKLVNLSLSIVEQSGDTQRFLKAKRFIEDNLTQKREAIE